METPGRPEATGPGCVFTVSAGQIHANRATPGGCSFVSIYLSANGLEDALGSGWGTSAALEAVPTRVMEGGAVRSALLRLHRVLGAPTPRLHRDAALQRAPDDAPPRPVGARGAPGQVRARGGLTRRGVSPRPLGPVGIPLGALERRWPQPVPSAPELRPVRGAPTARVPAPAPRGSCEDPPCLRAGHRGRGAAHRVRGPESLHACLSTFRRDHPGALPSISRNPRASLRGVIPVVVSSPSERAQPFRPGCSTPSGTRTRRGGPRPTRAPSLPRAPR